MINLARDFSKSPAGRFVDDGPYSGEKFRTQFLIPALSDSKIVVLDLDGTRGIGSSFLEEAFGGLVRLGYKAEDLRSQFRFKASDPSLVAEIESYWA